jgi:excisionase family DNA binding protein
METHALTIREFCDRFRISRFTFYELIRAGKLRARKVNRKTILLAPDVAAYEASLPVAHYRAGDRFGHKRFRNASGREPRDQTVTS